MSRLDTNRLASLLLGLVVGAGLAVSAGCSGGDAGQVDCSSHDECEVGTVCSDDGTCIETSCEFCEDDDSLICYEPEGDGEPTCSAPECESDDDCDGPGESCVEGQCKSSVECETKEDCDEGEFCNINNKCEEQSGGPDVGGGDDAGESDDAGVEEDVGVDGGGGACGGCPSDLTCDESTGQCVSGECSEVEECPPDNSPRATDWDPEICACVECKDSSDCSGDKECRNSVCQAPCTQKCGPNNGGQDVCSEDKPFCVSECCVECVGSTDCDGNQVCVDSVCQEEPEDCLTGGTCPEGHTCEEQEDGTGKCVEESSGQSCDPNNPSSCPQGEFCDPQSGSCQSASGGQGCGMCGQNCQCGGSGSNATCTGQLVCTGCKVGEGDCPSGQICFPAGQLGFGSNVCFPL